MKVYAYGIKPLYGGPDGTRFNQISTGEIITWKPFSFLHYWIDSELAYKEELRADGKFPDLTFCSGKGVKVELNGPQDFRMIFTGEN